MEPLNNGHIGGRDFVPCREVVHYRRSTIFLLIISPTISWALASLGRSIYGLHRWIDILQE